MADGLSHPDEVFDAARRLTDPTARSDYLDQACGDDPGLRRKVDALLGAYDSAGSFLEVPASPDLGLLGVTLGPSALSLREGPGTVIGPYKLLEQIGEGGMGVVFLAEQTRPVRRQVALKVIKVGMDTRQVVRRFEAERQALALMDHPNIARVLDAGATESGRPYFVMELVKGLTITRYCDEHRLVPRARLELFLQVCSAVQHAHTKGIIHRDLKPNNVLVASYDGRPVPKVIDFGVSKATGQPLTEATLFTGFGTLLGTPEYMSPEQAELNQLDVDTRSDVYSLGVLLYELLTSTTPLERGRVTRSALLEVLRAVREEEPPRPSTRLDATVELPAIAASRGLDPKKLRGVVRGELDWIVMKALEKDRNRRYETANGLARDVERYLSDEPVAACPPSAAYRVRKFGSRNRAMLITVAGLVVGVLVAVAALVVSNTRIRREATERQVALQAAKASKQDAVENLKDALRAVDQMMTRVVDDRPQNVSPLEPVRAEILQDAVTFYQRFLERGSGDPTVRQEAALAFRGLGRMHNHFGRYAEAEASYRKAVEMLAEAAGGGLSNPEAGLNVVVTKLGFCCALQFVDKPEEAEATIESAVALAERLAEEFPRDPEVVAALIRASNFLAGLLSAPGRDPDRAQTILLRNLRLAQYQSDLDESHRALGDLHTNAGQFAKAEASYRRASACAEQEVAGSPGTGSLRLCLAKDLRCLAAVVAAQGRTAEAEEPGRRAVDICSKLAAEFPTGPTFRNELAASHLAHADVLRRLGRAADATAACRSAAEVSSSLAADFPKVAAFQETALNNSIHLSRFHADAGRPGDAFQALEKAAGLYEKLPPESPARSRSGLWLAETQLGVGRLLQAQGAARDARTVNDRALGVLEQLAATGEAQAYRRDLARAYLDVANLVRPSDRPADAERLYRRASEEFTRLADESSNGRQATEDLAEAEFRLADYYRWRPDRFTDAEASFRQALKQYEKLSADFPEESHYRVSLADCRGRLGSVLLFQRRLEPAAKELGEARALAETLAEKHPADRTVRMTLAMASRHWGEAVRGKAPPADIEKAFRRAEGFLSSLVGESPDHGWYRIEWGTTCRMLAGLLARERNQPRDAETFYRRSVQVWDKLVTDFPNDRLHRVRRAEVHREWGLYLRDAGRAADANDVLGQAIEDLEYLSQGGSEDAYEVSYPLALLQVATGRLNEYRALCETLLPRDGAADQPEYWAVATCCLAPDAADDLSRAVRLAEKLLASEPSNADRHGVLGAALYRKGNFNEAVEQLRTGIEGRPFLGVQWQQLFLAMAYHRQGRATEARRVLDEACRWIDSNGNETLPPNSDLKAPLPWQMRLGMRLLRQEAERVLATPARE